MADPMLSAWSAPWPLINVGIIALHILLLLYGYWLIKAKKDVQRHPRVMILAGIVFLVFLGSFIVRILVMGPVPLGTWAAPVQPVHLQTVHAVIAVITVTLVTATYTLAARRRFDAHRRIAPWALALWIFTGIFGILGHFFYPRG